MFYVDPFWEKSLETVWTSVVVENVVGVGEHVGIFHSLKAHEMRNLISTMASNSKQKPFDIFSTVVRQ